MLRIITIIVLMSSLSCSRIDDNYINVGAMTDYRFHHDHIFYTDDEVNIWVTENISYEKDTEEYWQLPEETYELRTGDCEDIALLRAYFNRELGYEDNLLILWNKNIQAYHMINSQRYDEYQTVNWEYILEIPYEEAIWMTYYFHRAVGINNAIKN
jgi:ribonucleotide reductase beta subunit family protein with ferritin-like domain